VPIVSRVYPLSQIGEAMDYVSRGEHIGKVVVSHTLPAMEDRTEACLDALVAQRERARHTPRAAVSFALKAPVVAPEPDEAIAIVGMAGRFPQAENPSEFWRNILAGKNCVTEVPESRWPAASYLVGGSGAPGKTQCKWMGVLDHIGEFDPLFFNISPADAMWMDPQQRLFLENAWRMHRGRRHQSQLAFGQPHGRVCRLRVGRLRPDGERSIAQRAAADGQRSVDPLGAHLLFS